MIFQGPFQPGLLYDFVDKYHNTSTFNKKGLNSQENRNLISRQHSSKELLKKKKKKEQLFWKISSKRPVKKARAKEGDVP